MTWVVQHQPLPTPASGDIPALNHHHRLTPVASKAAAEAFIAANKAGWTDAYVAFEIPDEMPTWAERDVAS